MSLDDGDGGSSEALSISPSLPLELLPLILQAASSSNQLSTLVSACLVNRTWCHYAQPLLWHRIWLRDQGRVRRVFASLGSKPHLCRLVKILELRVYPLGLGAEDLEDLEENVSRALRAMTNLQELVWTRTGSLNDRVLPDVVASKPKLHTLELTGNTRYYDVKMLHRGATWDSRREQGTEKEERAFPFPSLKRVAFILPSSDAVQAVLDMAAKVSLQSINLLCQHTSAFLPVHADILSERVPDLERLILVGCKRVDGTSVKKLLAGSRVGIKALGLEGCAVHPSTLPSLAGSLSSSLVSLTITLPRSSFCAHSIFYKHLAELLQVLEQLKEFTLYAPGGVRAAGEDDGGDDDEIQDWQNGHGETIQSAANGSSTASSAASSQTPADVPRLPLSLIRALLINPSSGLPHRRLRLLRVHGIVCSLEGLRLIGEDASDSPHSSSADISSGGLKDLVVQLEGGAVLSIIQHLQPLSTTLEKLHILSRAGSELFLHEDDVSWIARSIVNAPHLRRQSGLQGSSPFRQIGFRNRVWEVKKDLADLPTSSDQGVESLARGIESLGGDDGDVRRHQEEVRVSLVRWDASEGRWPEALLVVKA